MKEIGRFLYRGLVIFFLVLVVQGIYFDKGEWVTVNVIGILAVIGVIAAMISEFE